MCRGGQGCVPGFRVSEGDRGHQEHFGTWEYNRPSGAEVGDTLVKKCFEVPG